METNDLQDLAARITAPMRTTGGKASLETVPPTLDLLARGKPTSPEEIAAASAKSPEEVRAALDRFPSAEWDEQGRVVGLGLTLRPTPHRLELEGPTLFAWCALDALLFPALLGRPACIESPCRGTGELVHIEVTSPIVDLGEERRDHPDSRLQDGGAGRGERGCDALGSALRGGDERHRRCLGPPNADRVLRASATDTKRKDD